jgi:hypothetical protein
MITVVVRVWMPDRPGALGQVASRIGAVRGDVLGIEILEHGADRVIDELTVGLPSIDLLDLLATEIDAVDGVSVETVRVVEPDRVDPNLSALAVGAAMAEAGIGERLDVLAHGVHRLIDADWAVVLRDAEVIEQVGDSPDVAWLVAFLMGAEHLTDHDETLPGDLVWGQMIESGLSVAAGRVDRPIHERERIRISLLARLADALIRPPVG